MNYIQAMIQQVIKDDTKRQEREIITNYVAAGQITPQGVNSAIKAMHAAATMNQQRKQALVIANVATAAAIRKQFTREEVEIIITPAAETLTAYIVKDEVLKQQLLEGIEKRGY